MTRTKAPAVSRKIKLPGLYLKSKGLMTFLPLLACLIWGSHLVLAQRSTAGRNTQGPRQAGPDTLGGAGTGAKVQAAVRRLFGPSVEPAAEYKSYSLTGDFNGDALEDLLVLVRLKGAKSSLPKEVTVLNPWGYETKSSAGTSALALAIIHAARGGWDTQAPGGIFLLSDREFFSTPVWESPTDEALIGVRKKGSPRANRRGSSPRAARGDTITLTTEAGIDVLLYWDGKTYRLDTPQEEP